jgi:flagellin-like hook-associated protein FlgL
MGNSAGNADLAPSDQHLSPQVALSDDIDVDLAEAISDLTASKHAFEVSLRMAASLPQITLLDFI